MASEWRVTRLGEICELFDGPHQTAPLDPEGPIVYLNVGDIRGGRVELRLSGRLSEDTARSWSSRVIPQPGDVVFGYEATLGHAALLSSAHRWCLGRRVGLLRPHRDRVDPRFLLYAWYSPRFQETLRANRVGGTTIESIRLTDLPSWAIELPDLEEQRRIADILGALDDKIELNRQMNEALEETGRALFKSWFVDFDPVRAKAQGRDPGLPQPIADLFPDRFEMSELGAIPAGWSASTLGDIADIVDCLHSKKPERMETGRPLLQLANIRDDGLIDMNDPYLIDDSDYQVWVSRMEARPGDCVVTNVGRVGAVAQIPEGLRAALGRNMTGIRCSSLFPFPTFLLESLMSDAMRNEISRNVDTGTILDALNVRNIPRLRLASPPLKLATEFESIARPMRQRMERALNESGTLSALRDALLPKLVSGELRVPPAERILEAAPV